MSASSQKKYGLVHSTFVRLHVLHVSHCAQSVVLVITSDGFCLLRGEYDDGDDDDDDGDDDDDDVGDDDDDWRGCVPVVLVMLPDDGDDDDDDCVVDGDDDVHLLAPG